MEPTFGITKVEIKGRLYAGHVESKLGGKILRDLKSKGRLTCQIWRDQFFGSGIENEANNCNLEFCKAYGVCRISGNIFERRYSRFCFAFWKQLPILMHY